jgi:uncharacterized protein (DUF58 family)
MMRVRCIPGPLLLAGVTTGAVLAAVALSVRMPLHGVSLASGTGLLLLAVVGLGDWWWSRRLWHKAGASLQRRLPPALAIGVRRHISVAIELAGDRAWQCSFHDHAAPELVTDGLPARARLLPGARTEITYRVTPNLRGEFTLQPAGLRLRSRLGLWELQTRLGDAQSIRVYPDFAQVARYAWLAGDQRLQEIGIKNARQRGDGTDFRQLAEYVHGDPVRHIDWKATLRQNKAIVRQYQDERDQRVWLLIDCGRRMRADDRSAAVGASHFDQVLNAVMLLSFVALREGDAVGARTFGTLAPNRKAIAPRKGPTALGVLMSQLYDLQPGMTHPDYLAAAREFLAEQPRRSLVVIITNFRDEDGGELAQALRLLRQRHLVMVASLRETVVSALVEQPLAGTDAAVEIASAHLHMQARQEAFARLAAQDSLIVDAEPQRLGIDLVNRYHAAKRAGML